MPSDGAVLPRHGIMPAHATPKGGTLLRHINHQIPPRVNIDTDSIQPWPSAQTPTPRIGLKVLRLFTQDGKFTKRKIRPHNPKIHQAMDSRKLWELTV
jgi:hypothetical protein